MCILHEASVADWKKKNKTKKTYFAFPTPKRRIVLDTFTSKQNCEKQKILLVLNCKKNKNKIKYSQKLTYSSI